MHIQICCFKKLPTEVWVDDSNYDSRGMFIPDAEYFKLEMSNPGARQQDFRKLRTTLLTSLRQGDNAYVHCMTGLARAPLAASLLASLLMNEDVEAAMRRVDNLRNVQLDKACSRMGGIWMDRLVNKPCIVHKESDFYLAGTSRPTSTVVHAGVTSQRVSGLANQPLCKWKRGVAGVPPAKPEHRAEIDTPEEARRFSETFCQDCLSKISASGRTRVQKSFHSRP